MRLSCSHHAGTREARIMPTNQQAFVLLCFSTIFCSCQNLEPDDNNKTIIERPYCFRFTWLGPKYNEESQFKNATCSDIVNDKNVPCTRPLVVTSKFRHLLTNPRRTENILWEKNLLINLVILYVDNSNIPDTEFIWNEYRSKPSQIACRLVRGEVCAKFSYTFNGASKYRFSLIAHKENFSSLAGWAFWKLNWRLDWKSWGC